MNLLDLSSSAPLECYTFGLLVRSPTIHLCTLRFEHFLHIFIQRPAGRLLTLCALVCIPCSDSDNRRCAEFLLNFSCTFLPSPRWNVTCALFCWQGGGVYVSQDAEANFQNCEIKGNQASNVSTQLLHLSCTLPPAPRWNVTSFTFHRVGAPMSQVMAVRTSSAATSPATRQPTTR